MDRPSSVLRDKRVQNLAAEISEAKDSAVPRLLSTQLQAILESRTPHSPELRQVKIDIWTHDLLHILLLSLKIEFNKLPEGWKIAAQLSTLLAELCSGLEPEDGERFTEHFLPESVDGLLQLATRLQNKFIKTSNILEDTKNELQDNYREVLDALSVLCAGRDELAFRVLGSQRCLQILMADDVRTSSIMLGSIQSLCRTHPGIFGEMEEAVQITLLDEMIYKLSASTDIIIAESAIKAVLVICDTCAPVVEMLAKRYKGLRPLLNKWHDRGFNRDVRRLQLLLAAGNMQRAEQQKLHQAAAVIQALWKSYYTRRKLSRANIAMAKFQRSFRDKQMQKTQLKDELKQQAELEYVLSLRHRHTMRHVHQRQLQTLSIIPASDLEKHFQNEQRSAAIRIQTSYRGWSVRKSLGGRRVEMRSFRAAVRIQRAVRAWLSRARAKKAEPPGWQRPPGLTDERRVELQGKIMEWREAHPISERMSREKQEELHDRVQSMLRQQALQSKLTRKKEHHRHALLAQLDMDAALLTNAPKLSEVTEKDLENFVSRSVPIATKARYNHQEELRLLNQPWWRKLGDEYQDNKLAEEQDIHNWKLF